MPITLIALKVLLLLMPGYLALSIRESLAGRRNRTELERAYVVLLYDIFVFGLYLAIIEFWPSITALYFSLNNTDVNMSGLTLPNIVIILSASLLLGIIIAIFEIHGWAYSLLRRLRFTYKTGRFSVWNDVFSEQKGYYNIVHLEDGTRIFGWICDYPTESDPKDFFIKDAKYLGITPDKDVNIRACFKVT